jgi:chromosome partitioning protein
VASFKGGVGKTTTAIHLAAYLSSKAKTLLIDGDLNRSASSWAKRGELPFSVIDERQAAKQARHFEHIIIDTQARPEQEDLEALADGCDLLVIPTTPDALSLDAMMLMVNVLGKLGSDRYKVVITIIPPKPSKDGDEARKTLIEASLPLFKTGIRRLVAFQKAALAGVPVYAVDDPRAKQGWADYQALGWELLR